MLSGKRSLSRRFSCVLSIFVPVDTPLPLRYNVEKRKKMPPVAARGEVKYEMSILRS